MIDATSLQRRQRWRKSLRFLRLKHLAHAGGMTALGDYQNHNDNCSTKCEKNTYCNFGLLVPLLGAKTLRDTGHMLNFQQLILATGTSV